MHACIAFVGQKVFERSLDARFQLPLLMQCWLLLVTAHRLVLHFATAQLQPLQVDGASVLPSTNLVRTKEHQLEPEPQTLMALICPNALLAPRDKDQHRAGAEPSWLRKAASGRGAIHEHAHI